MFHLVQNIPKTLLTPTKTPDFLGKKKETYRTRLSGSLAAADIAGSSADLTVCYAIPLAYL
jgi:hypothetical protein